MDSPNVDAHTLGQLRESTAEVLAEQKPPGRGGEGGAFFGPLVSDLVAYEKLNVTPSPLEGGEVGFIRRPGLRITVYGLRITTLTTWTTKNY